MSMFKLEVNSRTHFVTKAVYEVLYLDIPYWIDKGDL